MSPSRECLNRERCASWHRQWLPAGADGASHAPRREVRVAAGCFGLGCGARLGWGAREPRLESIRDRLETRAGILRLPARRMIARRRAKCLVVEQSRDELPVIRLVS